LVGRSTRPAAKPGVSGTERSYRSAHRCSVNSFDEFVLGKGMSGISTRKNVHNGSQPSRKSNVSRRLAGIVAWTSVM
jgi:hypothetical protein